jgi:hypothetical protein
MFYSFALLPSLCINVTPFKCYKSNGINTLGKFSKWIVLTDIEREGKHLMGNICFYAGSVEYKILLERQV